MPKSVLEKMTVFLKEEELMGGYKVAQTRAAEIAGFYTETAKLLHTKPHRFFIFAKTFRYPNPMCQKPTQR